MSAGTDQAAWQPPAPIPPTRDLPSWRLLLELRTSNISIWPEAAYDQPMLARRVFGRETLLVNDPAGIKQVLATRAADFERYLVTPRLLRPVAGDGVLLAEGDDWRRQRRSVSPAFTPATVDHVLPHFSHAAEALCGRIRATDPGSGVNLYRLFQTAAIDALGRGLFAMPFAERAERLGAMARAYFAGPGRPNVTDSFARHERQFALATWRRRRFERRWFAEIASIVDAWRARAAAAPGTTDARDIMTVLGAWRDPDSGAAMSQRETIHQAATMIAAGFETTALTMFWTVFLLANDRRRQAEIRREVNAAPADQVRSLKDLDRWPHLRNAIFEAMRLYPPVSFMSRIAIVPSEICGHAIAAGTIVVISPWVLHRHRSYWSDPGVYRPERFAGTSRAHLAGGAFIPFGSGPRGCLGANFAFAEIMILLARLFAEFEVDAPGRDRVMPRAIISTVPDVEPRFELRAARG